MSLTDKQKAFCREYIKDHNATQAAIRAGYSAKTAQEQSSRLLSNVMVNEFIFQLQQETAQRNELDTDSIVQELRKIAFLKPHTLYKRDQKGWIFQDPEDVPPETMDAISEISIIEIVTEDPSGKVTRETRSKFKPACKLKALEMLGKHIGMFRDKVDVTLTEKPKPADLSYTEWHGLSEDEKTVYLVTGKLPERPEEG